ncbi:MAG TPA: hypothetical protein DCL63_08595 [Firmicutes bacterium]|jgi:hypothetical protein|nr:hypothetical protein [Bacillota bacterium]HBK60677.1 hypothetical protein [Bacillota bacterium]
MKRRVMTIIAALVALVLAIAPHAASASRITVIEGTPVFFGGLSFSRPDEQQMQVKLDWIGLASDLEWKGATFRLGGAVNPKVPRVAEETMSCTFGLGAETARIFSIMAAVEGSAMAYLQSSGDGLRLALTGRITGATARIGVKADFGVVPAGFDTCPARLIGQDYWVEETGRDVTGKGWVDLSAALQSTRTRADSVRLAYMRALGGEDWRGDIGYNSKYSPEDTGVSIMLYSGLAFGGPSIMLNSKLTFRADVTDSSGAEIGLVAQTGGGSEHAWISGSGWLALGDRGNLKATVCAPILGQGEYGGPELFRPIDSSALSLGFQFNQGFLSSLQARYDLKTRVFGLEVASRF